MDSGWIAIRPVTARLNCYCSAQQGGPTGRPTAEVEQSGQRARTAWSAAELCKAVQGGGLPAEPEQSELRALTARARRVLGKAAQRGGCLQRLSTRSSVAWIVRSKAAPLGRMGAGVSAYRDWLRLPRKLDPQPHTGDHHAARTTPVSATFLYGGCNTRSQRGSRLAWWPEGRPACRS